MRRAVLALAVLAGLCAAPPATAAPQIDRTATLTAATPSFAWDGQQAVAAAPQQSVQGFDPDDCTKDADYYCDVTLVRIDAHPAATVATEFAIFDFAPAFADFDISIFRSDPTGAPGEFLANGGNLSAAGLEEKVPLDLEPGFYLVTVSYYFAPDATYKGTITARFPQIAPVRPAPAPAATPSPTPSATPSPTPAAKPARKAKPCRKGSRKARAKCKRRLAARKRAAARRRR